MIDGRAAARPESGGVERWTRELCRRLPRLRPGSYAVEIPSERFSHRLGHLWEQTVLPARARRSGAAALLCPANLAPLAAKRNIVVVHDVAPLRLAADFSRPYAAWQRFLLPRIVDRSLAVIVPSGFSREEVVAACGVDPAKVHVVVGGVADGFGPTADADTARERFGLERPYVLTVASRVARKNLGALDRSASVLADEGIEIVAVGGDRPQFADGSARVTGMRELGALDDSLLPGLYAGARAFVLPSTYEGFGLPVCEAMASGVPVVCSDAAALPEAAGGAARLVDPRDPEAIAQALLEVCGDGPERRRLIAAGLARTDGMDWQATAVEVDRVCRTVLGRE